MEVAARDRFTGKDEGQDYGRVVAMLGSRRVRCFCNDGVERICKIRGKLCQRGRKKFIVVGDIVLISPRDFSGAGAGGSESEEESPVGIWDLIDRIEPSDWRAIKKEGGHHPNLFGDGATGATTVDIFAMEDDADLHKEAVATVAAEEAEEELNIDNI